MSTSTGGVWQWPSPGRVLVVDDSGVIRAMVTRILQSAGFLVTEAEDGAVALSLLDRQPFDVVVTDLQMPVLDGLALLSAVRQRRLGTEVVALAGTHPEDMELAIQALSLGAYDYLTKPPSAPEAVVLVVRRALDKKRLHDSNPTVTSEAKSSSRVNALPRARGARFPRTLGLAPFAGAPLQGPVGHSS